MTIKDYPAVSERVVSEKLPNGLTVYVVPKSGFQKHFAFFAADYGGSDRRYKLGGDWYNSPPGVAHFLEHKLFEMEYGDALTRLSVNGADPNAYTSVDMTAFYFECAGRFSENLEILLEFVTTPYFSPESVAKEQGIIRQEILMSDDDPDFCLYYNLMKMLFRENPLRDPVAGTAESISAITADTLHNCHKVFYNLSNMVLCIAGNVDFSEVRDIALGILPGAPGEIPLRDYGPPEAPEPERSSVTASMDVGQPIFLAGCKMAPALRGPDILRLELVSVLALDLLAGHSSPLYMRLYAEGLVCSDFSASFEYSSNTAYSIFGGESGDPERVFSEVKREIQRLSVEGPDPELFRRIKKAAFGSQIRSLNSFEAICAGLAGGHFRGYDPFLASELISSITTDDITGFYRERLLTENMAISIVTPK